MNCSPCSAILCHLQLYRCKLVRNNKNPFLNVAAPAEPVLSARLEPPLAGSATPNLFSEPTIAGVVNTSVPSLLQRVYGSRPEYGYPESPLDWGKHLGQEHVKFDEPIGFHEDSVAWHKLIVG